VARQDEWERVCEECKQKAVWTDWQVVPAVAVNALPENKMRRGHCGCEGKGWVQVRPLETDSKEP
jgi:hypothetical protein